ncbi:MAG: hypothetical protein H7Z11_21340 [Verrucomicrobia bacterium]|nr:hypothetical protein [Leptolyngbya sp. ES-bin-22]
MTAKGCQDAGDLSSQWKTFVDITRSIDAGEMTSIIAKTPLGIEWRSSLKGDWFMLLPSMRNLVLNWNGVAGVNWFWDANFADGTAAKAYVLVPARLMQEIKDYLDTMAKEG